VKVLEDFGAKKINDKFGNRSIDFREGKKSDAYKISFTEDIIYGAGFARDRSLCRRFVPRFFHVGSQCRLFDLCTGDRRVRC
jgi:hypothetical protein